LKEFVEDQGGLRLKVGKRPVSHHPTITNFSAVEAASKPTAKERARIPTDAKTSKGRPPYLKSPTPSQHADDEQDDGNHQKHVDERTNRIGAHYAKQPRDQ
jgi:hypothetical protein